MAISAPSPPSPTPPSAGFAGALIQTDWFNRSYCAAQHSTRRCVQRVSNRVQLLVLGSQMGRPWSRKINWRHSSVIDQIIPRPVGWLFKFEVVNRNTLSCWVGNHQRELARARSTPRTWEVLPKFFKELWSPQNPGDKTTLSTLNNLHHIQHLDYPDPIIERASCFLMYVRKKALITAFFKDSSVKNDLIILGRKSWQILWEMREGAED